MHTTQGYPPPSDGGGTPFRLRLGAADVERAAPVGGPPDGPPAPPDPDQLGLWSDAAAPPRAAAAMDAEAYAVAHDGAAGRRARRARIGRRAVAAAAVLTVGNTLLVDRAHALFGIPGLPQVVIDPAAIAKLVSQISEMKQQLATAKGHVNAFVANTKKLTTPYAWRNIGTALSTVDGVMASGQALGYSASNLNVRIAVAYPGYAYNPATAVDDARERHRITLATHTSALRAAQATGLQLQQSFTRLGTVKTQLQGAVSAQQAAEVNATAAVTAAEELTLLRQQLLAQSSAAAVQAAEAANRELAGAAAVTALYTNPAAALAAAPPVRPAVTPGAYAF